MLQHPITSSDADVVPVSKKRKLNSKKKNKLKKPTSSSSSSSSSSLLLSSLSSDAVVTTTVPLVNDQKFLATSEASYTLILNQVKPLSYMLDVMGSVLKDCVFSIISPNQIHADTKGDSVLLDSQGFSGLCVRCIDERKCCIVIAKLQAQVITTNDQDISFCVPVATFLTHVKSISSNYCLQLYQTSKSADLNLRVYSPVISHHSRTMTISTLLKDNDDFNVSDINYEFNVEFELAEFQKIVKMAKGICSDFLRIRILENRVPTDTKRFFLIMHLYGESSYDEHCFMSTTDVQVESKGNIVIKNSAEITTNQIPPSKIPLSELKETFNNVFAVDYLNSFIRSLDRHTIVMRFAPNNPLILVSSLGDENSFVSIILAPRDNDSKLHNEIHSFDNSKGTYVKLNSE